MSCFKKINIVNNESIIKNTLSMCYRITCIYTSVTLTNYLPWKCMSNICMSLFACTWQPQFTFSYSCLGPFWFMNLGCIFLCSWNHFSGFSKLHPDAWHYCDDSFTSCSSNGRKWCKSKNSFELWKLFYCLIRHFQLTPFVLLIHCCHVLLII